MTGGNWRRRRFMLACLALLAHIAGAPAALRAAETFVAGIEDLPLMPGLRQLVEANVTFDTAAGRIIEAYATGSMSRAAVLEFYGSTLPQLGWARIGADAFRREGERLRLDFPAGSPAGGRARVDPGALVVRFFLSPG